MTSPNVRARTEHLQEEGRAFRSSTEVRRTRFSLLEELMNNVDDLDTLSAQELTERLLEMEAQSLAIAPANDVDESPIGSTDGKPEGATPAQIAQYTSLWTSRAEHVGSCTICLEDLGTGNRISTLPCFHSFHKECAHKWLATNRLCPMCQFDIITMPSVSDQMLKLNEAERRSKKSHVCEAAADAGNEDAVDPDTPLQTRRSQVATGVKRLLSRISPPTRRRHAPNGRQAPRRPEEPDSP
eukprot:CAMPEP_0206036334 /NCGR_PEP_ID=MMETSP1466-20131121/2691_1 /ASSEMBLY_ACC=CAM_ASM_001126 /TAXON_ID=44452 /ORGANISM="Pavlova gyrans, Strain CCMP608" /LENGTH=240 /DNA_ID=CAMNT_0053410791 /DNA_START=11 /DNA_END=733 /DNA_ORIENTATION=+